MSKLPLPKPDHSFTRKPQSKFAIFLWRRRMWIESTFAFTVMEQWEKILLITIFAVMFVLLITGLIKYLPQRLAVMQRRAVYYLWGGHEGDERLLAQWLSSTVSAGVGGHGEGFHKEL
ncbi:hypothetical protein D9615_005463 [Tricholomella constricta]|uniref:Uncharacterized protein n=1 Tax=Tricholomella constricta TaxID=117010 RepID=A0A8H5HE92_9AGAR|nr:hypothetical protein D9615_005463 [Tricholomella constricta]